VKDIVQFILRSDEIECDGSIGSNINIPEYDIIWKFLNLRKM